MEKIVIDSCIFVSNFGNDKFTNQSKLFFRQMSDADVSIVLPALVEAETLIVLKQNGKKDFTRIIEIFSQMEFRAVDKKTIHELTVFLKKNTTGTTKLKASDFLIAITAKLNKAILVTWDQQLLKNSICKTLTPQQYVESLRCPPPGRTK